MAGRNDAAIAAALEAMAQAMQNQPNADENVDPVVWRAFRGRIRLPSDLGTILMGRWIG